MTQRRDQGGPMRMVAGRTFLICASLLALVLSGCASGGGGGGRGPGGQAMADRRDGPPRPPPGRLRSDPGLVAAADFAMARAARDNGQWIAYAERAAQGAQLHTSDGPVSAATWLAARANPASALQWEPRSVWSSCDGSLAVSVGRSETADGTIGSYIAVWQRLPSGEYRWLYRVGTPDVPQPVRVAATAQPGGPDVIVAEAFNAIDARTADCGPIAGLPRDNLFAPLAGGRTGGDAGRDGTLDWRWDHAADGTVRVTVNWVRDGVWAEAVAFPVPAGATTP